ncbi:MAG: hypothetical protein HY854_17065 [Burkholderiales bacterium]|nr:hypothetical protein [Burkholderiales bacterium]
MKVELTIKGRDLDERHSGDWDFTFLQDDRPVAGGGGATLGEALVLAVAAAQAAGINVGEEE